MLVRIVGLGRAGRRVEAVWRADVDLGVAELRAVEQKGRLSRALLLEGDLCGLRAAGLADGNVLDLSAATRLVFGPMSNVGDEVLPEAEEIPDFLLSGVLMDALDVDSGRHDGGLCGGLCKVTVRVNSGGDGEFESGYLGVDFNML